MRSARQVLTRRFPAGMRYAFMTRRKQARYLSRKCIRAPSGAFGGESFYHGLVHASHGFLIHLMAKVDCYDIEPGNRASADDDWQGQGPFAAQPPGAVLFPQRRSRTQRWLNIVATGDTKRNSG